MRKPLLLIALLLTGCGKPPQMEPTLDTAVLFPELDGAVPAPTAEKGAIPLAGELAGVLPLEGWSRYAGPGITILSHAGPDGSPDALVWAEAFSSLADLAPSRELRRFLLTVDPALVRRTGAWPPLPPGYTVDGQAVAAAMTRTGGRGIGFTSAADGFSGWRWTGANAEGVFLRLAVSRGAWGEPGLLPLRLREPVDRLIEMKPRLEWLRAAVAPDDIPEEPRRSPVPATLILGNATGRGGRLHLALLCRRAPSCTPAVDLAHLLATLQPLESATSQDGDPPRSLGDLDYELGLPVAPSEALLDPMEPGSATR
jgi:hypothetical protein